MFIKVGVGGHRYLNATTVPSVFFAVGLGLNLQMKKEKMGHNMNGIDRTWHNGRRHKKCDQGDWMIVD